MNLKTIARLIYGIMPDNLFKKKAAAFVYRKMYGDTIKSCLYKNGLFTVVLKNGIKVSSIKDFDPEPLIDDLTGYRLPEKPVIMDLGGNIGAVAIYLAKLGGAESQFTVFEPDNANIEIIEKNIFVNDLNKQIKLIKKGVWNEETELDFFSGGNYTSSFLSTNYIEDNEKLYRKTTVPVTTVDLEAKKQRLEKIDLIKIDIEGSEVKALIGAEESIRKWHPDLIIETHIVEGRSTKNEVLDFIKKMDYNTVKDGGDIENPVIFATNREEAYG